jgi:hypothetical protein
LQPCPFCGSEMESSHGAFGHVGGQPNCPIYYTAFDDAEAGDWNARIPDPEAAKLREALTAIGSQAICYGMKADETELRDWLKFISETAEAALNLSPALVGDEGGER